MRNSRVLAFVETRGFQPTHESGSLPGAGGTQYEVLDVVRTTAAPGDFVTVLTTAGREFRIAPSYIHDDIDPQRIDCRQVVLYRSKRRQSFPTPWQLVPRVALLDGLQEIAQGTCELDDIERDTLQDVERLKRDLTAASKQLAIKARTLAAQDKPDSFDISTVEDASRLLEDAKQKLRALHRDTLSALACIRRLP